MRTVFLWFLSVGFVGFCAGLALPPLAAAVVWAAGRRYVRLLRAGRAPLLPFVLVDSSLAVSAIAKRLRKGHP